MLILQLFLLMILVLMAWQDFKFRAIYWWLFPLLLVGLLWLKIDGGEQATIPFNLLTNGLFLSAQFLLLSLYFSIKERKWVNLFKAYFGLGDLLFLLCLTVYFSFLNYILFYIATLFLVILITVLTRLLSLKANTTIPLAGWQALMLCLLMLLELSYGKMTFIDPFGFTSYLALSYGT